MVHRSDCTALHVKADLVYMAGEGGVGSSALHCRQPDVRGLRPHAHLRWSSASAPNLIYARP